MRKRPNDSKVPPPQEPGDDVLDEGMYDDYMADRECRADFAADGGRGAAEFSARGNVTFFTRDRRG